jgi:type IV secretory pathway VirB2 component (pilin)
MKMNRKIIRIFYALEILGFVSLVLAQSVYAAAGSEDDLGYFLERIGDFLIRTIGPGLLVIGVAVAGVSMALGDDKG